MLIVFSGLPGTGKTTIARELARQTGAVYLRIDVIEQAIRDAGVLAGDLGASGYGVANALALSNLQLGHKVVADCVNPVQESRVAWQETAATAGVALANIQVVCSDAREHQRRVETREGDISGLTPPSWTAVLKHDYEVWSSKPFSIDTSLMSATAAVLAITDFLSSTYSLPVARDSVCLSLDKNNGA